MASVNKCTFIGNVGKDPVIKTAGTNNTKFASFSLACSEKRKDKNGQIQEHTDWVPVKVFIPALIDITEKYIRKGMQLYVEARYTTSTYMKDGEKKYTFDLIATSIQMLGTKAENQALASGLDNSASQQNDSAAYQMGDAFAPKDDDLPF